MTVPYRLHYAPDNASLIVRLVLDELGQPYVTQLVDRSVQAQRSAAYLRLNPNGLIPVLETADGPLFETAAILLWLADRHHRMAPAPDSAGRGAFLKWLFFVSNTLHPALRIVFYPDKYIGPGSAPQAQLRRHMQGEIPQHLAKLETLAGDQPCWFGGAERSVFDFYVACALRWMQLYPRGETAWCDIGKWPLLQEIVARLERCEAVRHAIHAEGLGPTPFTAPHHPNPPEGSAT